jgi:hypothetical protein
MVSPNLAAALTWPSIAAHFNHALKNRAKADAVNNINVPVRAGSAVQKQKPAAMFARARHSLDDVTMPVICPTSQILWKMRANAIQQIETAFAIYAALTIRPAADFLTTRAV